MKMEFSLRIRDLEVRSCDEYLSRAGVHDRAEIIRWDDNKCYTVARFVPTKDAYDLCSVGDRILGLFEYTTDFEITSKLIEFGFNCLNVYKESL